jgi:sulfotransferase
MFEFLPLMPTSKIFYQSSMPRSGSTLLQNIMAQNPAFYVTPTSGVLELVFGARLNYTNGAEFKAQDTALMKKAFLQFCRQGMEGFYGAITDKSYVLDKSRGWGVHFDLLQTIFAQPPKIVCMVRDLRAVMASMEKKFRQNPERHKPTENHQQMTGNTTFKRAVDHLRAPPVGLALDRLIEVHQRGWAKQMLFVRFEDLTSDPATALKKIYTYLGVPEYVHDFSQVRQVTQEDDTVFGIPGLHDIRPEVRPVKNDYLEVLGRDAVRHIEANFGWYFQMFGYHPTAG